MVFAVLLGLQVSGQEEKVFTLQECIAFAQEKSPAARIARKTYQAAYWDFKAFKASLLPAISGDGNIPGFGRQIISNIQDDGTQNLVTQDQSFSDVGLRVTQALPFTGGNLSVSSGLSRIQVFGTSEYMLWQSSPFVVSINQPLFQYNSLKWNRQTVPLRFKVAEAVYLETLQDIAQDVTEGFFNVFIAQINLQNSQFNQKINDTVYQITKGRYNVGKIGEDALLTAELAQMRSASDVETQTARVETAMQDLAIRLGLPVTTRIIVIPPTSIPDVQVDFETAKSQAARNRSTVQDFELRRISAESDLAQAKYSNRFNANLRAAFGFNNSDSTISGAYAGPQQQQTFTVGFQVPIFQWGKINSEINAAEARRDRTMEQIGLEKKTFVQEVRSQVIRFDQLKSLVLLDMRADTIAQRRFSVAKNRYMIGKIDLTTLQIAQNEKDNARARYIQTLSSYWAGFFRLRRLTLYDFEKQQPLSIPARLKL